ncbi:MAG: chorismate synthase [Gemmatimonadaceae bacterium]|nr:chorismate synthase [Gemmatimonadaceae bacterium]
MRLLRLTTAGESHGPALVCTVEGMPAGIPLLAADINADLFRRQQGYGRGRRMQIERDEVEFLSGVRAGQTLGSPIAMLIRNRDWKNWVEIMDPAPRDEDADGMRKRAVTRPRPGHADLTGVLKYDREDARDILERASARETTARVAGAAIARALLKAFGITVGSHLVHLGGIDAAPMPLPDDLNAVADASPVRTLDPEAEARIIARIDQAKAEGDTLGGICEIVARGLPVGLGSHVSWDRKLDGRVGQAMLSIPAVKGVELGMGFESARQSGASVHDAIAIAPGRTLAGNVQRTSNRAGGLDGGMTNGEPVVVRVAMKPIATLMTPLQTIDTTTSEVAAAVVERSDVTAVPAMGVIAEAMLALVLADAMLEKFGGDSLGEMRRNYDAYLAHVAQRLG